ncbi:MAG: hypothetical protein SWY16_22120 [Cyanobacteriota bacterium]|nr:hypothetical protein [Cyanobacteriota bacterium]
MPLDNAIKSTVRDAAKKLSRPRKREFMAKVTEDYLDRSARKAERIWGWKRQSVELGLHERRSGLTCVDNYRARGRQKSEEILPQLEGDIRALVDGHAQADPNPKFQSVLCYARISARAVREALITQKGYDEEQLPTRQTIGEILNRFGYRLKKPKKPSL